MIKKPDASSENGTYAGRLLHCEAQIIMLCCISRDEITDLPSVLLVLEIHLDISVSINVIYLQGKSQWLLSVPMVQAKLYLSMELIYTSWCPQ